MTELARGAVGEPGDWLWALAALALYAVISYGLEYRARLRRGSRHPARDALHDLRDREEPQRVRDRVVSRLIMLTGGALTGLVAWLTTGGARVAAVACTAILAAVLWAWFDHRTETRAFTDSPSRGVGER
ncbi:hypothetical protein ACIQPQ_02315 [Streptomyces sp. NPDC091281]|uniref:hypothetical protein n=1 Tax=Streptomyces sp. NPDC091281 TaxID=3365985 RepID=UPI003816F15B